MTNQQNSLHVVSAPFIKQRFSYTTMLVARVCVLAMLLLGGVWFWGFRVLLMTCVAVIVSFVMEWLTARLTKTTECCFKDFSALIIAMGFVLLLPVNAPLWVVAAGVGLSMLFGKLVFGGIAYTPFPPLAVGYTMVSVAWGTYLEPSTITTVTELISPLVEFKTFGIDAVTTTYVDYVIGNQLAVIGATSLLLVLIALVVLLITRSLSTEILLGYVLGVAMLAAYFYTDEPSYYAPPTFFLTTGTVLLSVILMLTDFSSLPVCNSARFVYGFIVGCLVVLIRTYTSYYDGTPLAILLASFLVPYCDIVCTKFCRVRRG